MDLSLKGIAKIVLMDVLFPFAEKYVAQTDNKWDDDALKFLEELAAEFLK